MKNLATLFFFFVTIQGFCQEKTNYNKDVYPLIKEGKYTEAIPLLEQFLKEKPTHVNANYWYAKIMESEGKRLSDPTMIDKAKTHYLTCSKNVSDLDMTMATAGRFPDVTGLESAERLQNFQAYLSKKNSELPSLKEKITRENEQKKYEAEKIELQRKKQNEEDAKIKSLEFTNVTIDDFISNTGLFDIKKILGPYGGNLTQEEEENNNVWNFNYEYNIVDGKKVLNGKIEGSYDLMGNEFYGEIHNGSGFVSFLHVNYDSFESQAIKLIFENNKCVKLRGETSDFAGNLYVLNETNPDSFDISRYWEITDNAYSIIPVDKKIIENLTWPLVSFKGYYNNQDEGADIPISEFQFAELIKKNRNYQEIKELNFAEENVNTSLITILMNSNSNGKFFELKGEAYYFMSEIFQKIDTHYVLKEIKEIKIFSPESYSSNYKEVVSEETLISLNNIAKKWHESLVNGNYDVFKSLCTKHKTPSQEEFNKLHSSYSGFPTNTRYKFQKSNDYLVSAADFFILFDKDFFALKNSGCDMTKTIALVGLYQEKRGDHYERNADLVFIKENGSWKVLYLLSEDINRYNLKAYQALTKENITPCGCVEKIINGDTFGAEKCAFYFRYKKLDNESQAFESCFQSLNYCDYQKQKNALEIDIYRNKVMSQECLGQK